MNTEIEKLIDLALADGEITDKERSVILKKAVKLGEDPDEVEMILDGRLQLKSSSKKIIKCPNCGQEENGISQVCSACGFVLKEKVLGENSKSLNEKINYLENLLIEIKSIERKSTFQKTIPYISKTIVTGGIYIVYDLFKNKLKNDPSTNLISKSEKEIRIIRNQYGQNKSINSLIEEIDQELSILKNIVKKDKKTNGIGCLSVIIFYLIINGISFFWGNSEIKNQTKDLQEIKILLSKGEIDKARNSVILIEGDLTKDKANNLILSYEIELDIKSNHLEDALNKSSMITISFERENIQDRIYLIMIDDFLNKDDREEAIKLTNKINNSFERENIQDKIYLIMIDDFLNKGDREEATKLSNKINNSYNRKNIQNKIKNYGNIQ